MLLLQVLHHLLLNLFEVVPRELLMEFLAVDEQLLDIGDDLVDYEVSITINPMCGACVEARKAC